MTKRLVKTLLLPFIALAMAFAFISCGGETPAITYTVTYVIGENAQGTAPVETDKAIGEKFKIKSADGITCEGMKFMGWMDGSDIVYRPDDEYTMPSKAVVFTALWHPDNGEDEGEQKPGEGEEKPGEGEQKPGEGEGEKPAAKYKVTYKYGAAGDDVVKTDQAAENYTVEDPATYEDTGADDEYYKLFAGWKVEGDSNIYLPGVKCTLTGDTEFTAQWVDFETDDYVWFDTTFTLQFILLSENVGTYILSIEKGEDDYEFTWTYFTYSVSDTTITVTPVNGNPITGNYDNGELTISIKIGMSTYKFEPEQEKPTGKPTISFEANGGTGDAPVIDDEDITYNDNLGLYRFVLPQNTFIAPEGKEFKGWNVNDKKDALGNLVVNNANTTYNAEPGEIITIKPLWKDTESQEAQGIEFSGNCTLPVRVFFGGETVVKIIIDNTDMDNWTITYNLTNSSTNYVVDSVQASNIDNVEENVYGDGAKYYGSFKIGNLNYYVLVNSDFTKLWLCDQDDALLENGEFNKTGNGGSVENPPVENPPETEKYTVTYVKPDGATGDAPEQQTVAEGAQVTLPEECPFAKAGWTFVGWEVTGFSALRAGNTKITVTQNTTITAVFSADYTGNFETIAVRDNGTLVMDGETYGYTRNGNIVVVNADGYLITAKVDDVAKTYVVADGMQSVSFTAANNATLTFDGFGVATLGTHTGTYTLSENYDKFTLVIGGSTYSDIAIGTTINVKITVDGTEYVFGTTSDDNNNSDPPENDKLADYVGESSSAPVKYGYASVEDAKAANQNITASNISNSEKTFYYASVYKGWSGIVINICNETANVSNPKNAEGQSIKVDEDTPNQKAYITNGSWPNTFVITFSKNSDGKRVMTITYGDITVRWVEISAEQ